MSRGVGVSFPLGPYGFPCPTLRFSGSLPSPFGPRVGVPIKFPACQWLCVPFPFASLTLCCALWVLACVPEAIIVIFIVFAVPGAWSAVGRKGEGCVLSVVILQVS